MGLLTSNYKIISGKAQFFALYQCSHCVNPLIRKFVFTKTDQSKDYAVESSQWRADTATEEAKQKVLEYLDNPTKDVFKTVIGKMDIPGFDIPCPICGAKEPWQQKNFVWKNQLAFPISFYPDLIEPVEEAKGILRKRLVKARNVQNDVQVRAGSEQEYSYLKNLLQSLNDEYENGQAAVRLRSLQNQKQDLDERIKAAGMFSKEKKELQNIRKNCEAEITEAKKGYREVCTRLDLSISETEQKLWEAGYPFRRYSGNAVMIENDTVIALRLCEEGEQADERSLISLSLMPERSRYVASVLDIEHSYEIKKLIRSLEYEQSKSRKDGKTWQV